ncbi:MAG TPA: type II secretion system protein, partial [Stellaceae bacterium]|nr:type II secretion system protein [Stellaceae bacterium]
RPRRRRRAGDRLDPDGDPQRLRPGALIRMRADSGFTLIEMPVVIAIVALIAGTGAVQPVDKTVGLTLVTASQERIDAAPGDIRFFADGSSTGGGIGLHAGARGALILVDWLPGRVSIVEGADAARR